jgi:P4 family phage/plasmid primase-like protien
MKKRPSGFDPYVEQHFETETGLQYGSWNKYQGQSNIDERSVFPNEIVIDIDAEDTETARKENQKVLTYLDSNGYDYIVADTGGTGFHIHLFFNYKGLDAEDYREYRIALYQYLKEECRENAQADIELWDDQPVLFDISNSKGHLVRALGGRKSDTSNRKTMVLASSLEKNEIQDEKQVKYPQRIPWSLEISKTGTNKSDLSISEINEKVEEVKKREEEKHEGQTDTKNIDTKVEGLNDVRDIPSSKVLELFGYDYKEKQNFECPFHSDNDPSANLHTRDGVERLYCFSNSCAEESTPRVWNAVDILVEEEGYSFQEAIKKLGEEFDIQVRIGFNPHDYFDNDIKDNYSVRPQRIADEITDELLIKNVIDGGFYVWNDKYWEEISDDNDVIGREVDKRLKNETSSRHRNNVKEIIKNRDDVQVTKEEFNVPEGLIPFKNGLYNVFEGELIEHSPEYNFDFIYNVSYKPELENDDVKRLIHTIVPESKDKRMKLREIAALSLAPWKINQKVPILYGQGSNGKNQYAKIIWKMLGEESYHKTSAAKLQNDKFEMASVVDKQMAFFDEFEDVTRPGQLKTLIGDERQNVREMRKESYTTKTSVYPIFAANELPNPRDESDGFYRRWEIIDFNQKFTADESDGNPTKIPPSKLEEEYMSQEALDAFATSLIDDLNRLLEDNKLTDECNTDETRLKWKKKGNALYAFIDQFLVPGDLPDNDDEDTQDYIIKDELLEIVNNYMEVHNNSKIKKHRLTKALDAHPDFRIWKTYRPRTEDGNRPRAYAGIKFDKEAGPVVQPYLMFSAYASPPVRMINELGKWVDQVDHDKLAEVLHYLTQKGGENVSLFELVRNVDLTHDDVPLINSSDFVEIESSESEGHSYPVYSLDTDSLDDADISVDLTSKKIDARQSMVKDIVEGEYGDDENIEIQDLVQKVVEEGLQEDEAEEIIDKLKRQGEFFEPKNGFIKET